MTALCAVLSTLAAYVLGSIPSGVLAGRLVTGVEVRNVGSGRTGGTNVYRAAGPWALALTVLGDITKGILAVWAARFLMIPALMLGASPQLVPWAEALAGIAAVAGHNWSLFLRFKGGAGTATTLGALATLSIHAAVAIGIVGLAVIALSRMASVGSISIAVAMGPAMVVAAAVAGTPWSYVLFAVFTGALTIYALLPNIRRIMAGQERQLKTAP